MSWTAARDSKFTRSAGLRRVFALALCSALLLSACGDDASIDTEGVIASELLEASAERMDAVESFRFRLEHEGGAPEMVRGLPFRSAEGAVAGPDRMEVTASVRAGPMDAELSIIVLPEQSWITNPITGRWEREDISIEDVFDPASGVTGIMRLAREAEVVDGERIDGVDAYVVEATVDSGDLAFLAPDAVPGRMLPVRAWVGVDEPLVYRFEVEGAVGEGEPEQLVRRLTLSDHGADIDIAPPR